MTVLRSIEIPCDSSEPYADNVLPAAAARANMLLAFSAAGAPVVVPQPTLTPSALTLIDTVTGLPVTITVASGVAVVS